MSFTKIIRLRLANGHNFIIGGGTGSFVLKFVVLFYCFVLCLYAALLFGLYRDTFFPFYSRVYFAVYDQPFSCFLLVYLQEWCQEACCIQFLRLCDLLVLPLALCRSLRLNRRALSPLNIATESNCSSFYPSLMSSSQSLLRCFTLYIAACSLVYVFDQFRRWFRVWESPDALRFFLLFFILPSSLSLSCDELFPPARITFCVTSYSASFVTFCVLGVAQAEMDCL